MQVVIPMSGRGERFRRAGFTDIKPLIRVDGRPMIEHVLGMFPGPHRMLCICAQDHLQTTPLASVIRQLRPDAEIAGIEPHKHGPVHAVLAARDQIADDEPVLISYCDFTTHWSFADFTRHVAQTRCAGAITAYRGFHPHSLGPNLYAYMRERDGMLVEIREKGCFTADRMHEYASAGSYYFASGALMKRSFARAVELGLSTNGEYYCSTPYNLLVQDGLPVLIYELDDFVQLGTPEDLSEYQQWSDFFAASSEFRPELPVQAGATLVPAAGEGRRFRERGYLAPKPLIEVDGQAMLERSLSTLPTTEQCVILARGDVLDAAQLRPALQRARGASGIEMVLVEKPTEGQASTCLLAEDRVDGGAPLLIAPCDASTVFDPGQWAGLVQDLTIDCVVWCFRDHPHANRNPNQYGWVETSAGGRVRSVSCKRALHVDVRGDLGIIGIFWFRRADVFFDTARALLAENRRVNGEFYVDSVVQLAVELGRDVRAFRVERYTCFGTPDDVMTYEYWHRYFVRDAEHPFARRAAGRTVGP